MSIRCDLCNMGSLKQKGDRVECDFCGESHPSVAPVKGEAKPSPQKWPVGRDETEDDFVPNLRAESIGPDLVQCPWCGSEKINYFCPPTGGGWICATCGVFYPLKFRKAYVYRPATVQPQDIPEIPYTQGQIHAAFRQSFKAQVPTCLTTTEVFLLLCIRHGATTAGYCCDYWRNHPEPPLNLLGPDEI
jgi:hypothetical protein